MIRISARSLAPCLAVVLLTACGDDDASSGPIELRALTFNGGTTDGLPHDLFEGTVRGDGYTSAMAEIADELYENSLSWNPAEAALTRYLAAQRPAIAAFQEIFHDPWCETIPVDPALDFVCRGYSPDRPLQVERLLGPDYQVACAEGQEDNCLGVRRDVGRILDCPLDEPCPGGLAGTGPPDGCSRGARVGRLVVELADGRELVVVNVHGTSGFSGEDMRCRVSQFEQVFVDRGDGTPAADGERNLVLGDLNTDPLLLEGLDPSATTWVRFVGDPDDPDDPDDPRRFRWISSPEPGADASYLGLVRIDHVVSDVGRGSCFVGGVTGGTEPPTDAIYWDHRPVVCDLAL